MHVLCVLLSLACLQETDVSADKETVFSGPQPGEIVPELLMTGVFDDLAGQTVNVTEQIGDKPALVIFIHERTRPTFGMMNALSRFAESRRDKGLKCAVCLLSSDATETESWLKQVRRYLPATTNPLIGISPDGIEGPGAWGLNRHVAMTVLVADQQKVSANYALVQPGLDVDGPKILKSVVDVTGGGEVPAITEFLSTGRMQRDRTDAAPEKSGEPDERLRPLLRNVIRKDATDEEVDAAAKDLLAFVEEHPELRAQIATVANRIIDAGKLQDYGTPRAQKYLTEWSTQFKQSAD